MIDLTYHVHLEPAEEGGFVVTFPDVPEVITQGEDEAEAVLRAADALETALEFYVDAGRNLSRPSRTRRGQAMIGPRAQARD
jgi:antitoxin HicB